MCTVWSWSKYSVRANVKPKRDCCRSWQNLASTANVASTKEVRSVANTRAVCRAEFQWAVRRFHSSVGARWLGIFLVGFVPSACGGGGGFRIRSVIQPRSCERCLVRSRPLILSVSVVCYGCPILSLFRFFLYLFIFDDLARRSCVG